MSREQLWHQGDPDAKGSLAAAALSYADKQWPVFPCSGKVPLLEHGFHQATTEPDLVRHWWDRWPMANIGIRTGVAIDVVDIDSEAGLDRLRERACGQGLGDLGPVAKTGEGWHIYVASGEKLRPTRIRFLEDCDYKAAGGYVIAPPSRHPSGRRYEWLWGPDRAIPKPPPGWLATLIEPPPPPPRREWRPPEGSSGVRVIQYAMAALRSEASGVARASEGTRNDTLNKAAFKMRKFVDAGQLDPARVTEILSSAAQVAGLPLGEALRTIHSGLGTGR